MSSATPSKRPADENGADASGDEKRQKVSEVLEDGSSVEGVALRLRVLCPASRIDAFIGEGNEIIARIMEDTGAVISVRESTPDCDVRVIVVTASDMEELGTKPSEEDGVEADRGDGDAKGADGETTGKEDGGENEDPDENARNDDRENMDDDGESRADGGQTKDNDGEAKERNECGSAKDIQNCEDEESLRVKRLRHERMASCVLKALLFIFDKLVDLESGKETKVDDGDKDSDESSLVLKLLVDSSQMRCLLKNDSMAINEMMTVSGAQIQILRRDDLPRCALPSDEVVQISGESGVLRKGLELVGQQIIENLFPFLDAHVKSSGPSSQSTIQSHPISHAISSSLHSSNVQYGSRNGRHPGRGGHSKDGFLTGLVNPPLPMLSFRILCNGDRVGSVIGKGGTGIKSIKQETGSEITIMDGVPDSEERVIVVSGPAHPDDRISPIQDALVRVHKRILGASANSNDGSVLARILVSSNQIGCVLGVGGAVIAEMRKSSRAYIRIVGKDQVPKCAMLNEEVVQVSQST
ncbi:hypothetical protein MLD38_012992 [Melastoma candidum]|uniref:Uncharacterized protein n=1 Tax=Melastoma candidum TaxID=119954 RepID=A0ACB9RB91_9MYRT|nr:hypothetical protein MLD38_012992 [Melastoma candidum]